MPSSALQAARPDIRTPRPSFGQVVRAAAWLGWQIHFNWMSHPLWMVAYILLRPLATVAILVVMYGVVTQGAWHDPLFAYLYVGNAFYMFVGGIFQDVAWAVIDDREHYYTLKYLALAPMDLMAYLLGRGLTSIVLSSRSVLVVLVAGVWLLDLPLDLRAVDWPLLGLSMALGMVVLVFMGLLLAAVSLNATRYLWVLGEAVGGALYLFSGAIFPLEVLPRALQPVGRALPITYWLELVRRALLPGVAAQFPTWQGVPTATVLTYFVLSAGATILVGWWVFRWGERRARAQGLLERTSEW